MHPSLSKLKQRVGGAYRQAEDRIGSLIYERGDFVDTAPRVYLQDLGLKTPERHRYQASSWHFLPRALRKGDVGPGDVFVEFGCGKGRVVFQAASRYPFKRVVGVDLGEPLIEVAKLNVENNRDRLQCQDVQLEVADVLEWDIPDDMTIAYMFNPFGGEVFERTIERIIESLDRAPRRLRIIYAFPMLDDVIEKTGRFRLAREIRGLRRGYVPTNISIWEST